MPDRVAIVYDSLYPVTMGGGERLYGRLAELLAERAIQTDYVTRQFVSELRTTPVSGVAVVGVWLGEIYDARGIRTVGSAVGFALAVFRYFRKHRRDYDMVLASSLPVLTALATRLALLGSGTRVVADWLEVWPGSKWREYSGPVAGTIASALQWLATRVIREHTVDSRFTAARLARVRPSLHPVVFELFDRVREGRAMAADEPPFVVFVGRLIPDKGVIAIPAALAIARAEIPGLRAVIIGDGPERGALEAAIGELELREHIDVLGRVSDELLDARRARAVALIAPSIREGFGLAVAEALARGVPVVVVAHEDNAAVDLVEAGVNGFVVAPNDPAALAAGIVDAVRGGPALRQSSFEWFDRARVERSLRASLDEILGAANGLSD
jgi:glycosyltransferase involved in cell wall biosynthesis